MKLLKKIVPIATVATTISGVVPMITSCTNDDSGWIDGKTLYDTKDFKHCLEQMAVYDGPEQTLFNWEKTCQAATDEYIKAIKENPNIIYDDFKTSLNTLDQIVTMFPQFFQGLWAQGLSLSFCEIVGQILSIIYPEIGEIIAEVLYFLTPYSPIENIQIHQLRGKLNDFNIDAESEPTEWTPPLVSYNESFEADATLKVGFDYIPEIILELIQQLIGITPSFNLNAKLRVDADLNKIPVVVWGDMLARAKKQIFSVISGEEYDNHEYYGFCFVPDIQDKEYLTTNQDWSAQIDIRLTLELKGKEFDVQLFSGTKQTFIFDYDVWSKLFGDATILYEIDSAVVFLVELLLGWSSYYYYDQIYPNTIGL